MEDKPGKTKSVKGNRLLKLKKSELLEIMLEQSREIDALRAENEELKTELENRRLTIRKAGSLAEASLALSDIFKEADKAAAIYLDNIKQMAEEAASAEVVQDLTEINERLVKTVHDDLG